MNFLTDHMHWIAGAFALVSAVLVFVLLRRKKGTQGGGKLGLEELVTLDSKGWALLAAVGFAGAVVMIGSSAAIGVDYWSGLAINADVTAGNIRPETITAGAWFGWFEYITVGVIAFIVIALVFEFFSDLGAPMASGLKQRKKKLIPELVLAATVGCVIMSLVTKWGYYDDKVDVRRVAGAETLIDVDTWKVRRDEAQTIIDELASTPGAAVADAREATANTEIIRLEGELEDAKEARDALPVDHSTNRARAQESIDEISDNLAAQRAELVVVAGIRDALTRKAEATSARDEAVGHIRENAGAEDGAGATRQRAGDLLLVRILRVGLHQYLCWLFPIVCLESLAAYRDQRKKEEANERRRETQRAKSGVFDTDWEDVSETEADAPKALGYADTETEPDESEEEELARLKEQATAEPTREDGYDNGEAATIAEGEADDPASDDVNESRA